MKTLSLLRALAVAGLLSAPAAAHLEDDQIWLIDYVNDSLYRVKAGTWDVFTTLGPSAGLNGRAASASASRARC